MFGIGDRNEQGVIDIDGNIIVPFKYESIEIKREQGKCQYIVATSEKGVSLYSPKGEIITENVYAGFRRVCSGGTYYFRLRAKGAYHSALKGIAYFNPETLEFKVLFEPQFESISCFSTEEGKPIATIRMPDKTKGKVYGDGRLVLEE